MEPHPLTQKLIDYFRELMPLTNNEAEAIRASVRLKTALKGDILLREGQVSTECYFVLQGCVRQYYLVDGEERTTNFFTEGQWVISLKSFSQRSPADHYFACLEETVLVVGNEQREQDMYSQSAKFESISRLVMERIVTEQQEMTAKYLTETPEQRYHTLLTTRPDLLQRIPQYQLASYVGVKPESLSRIRKRIATKKRVGPVNL